MNCLTLSFIRSCITCSELEDLSTPKTLTPFYLSPLHLISHISYCEVHRHICCHYGALELQTVVSDKYITQTMKKQGICAIILKGAATASYYPVPELRKSGDIDILIPEEGSYHRAVRILKEEGFVAVLTKSCVKYLGLREENVSFLLDEAISDGMVDDFMEEVFTAGEFGHDTNQRMVAMRGTGIGAYIREFHHQMHLNYPKAGKIFLLWPALWTMTLVRFLHNNRTVRNVKGRDILKEAGKRSRLIDKMKLFS